MGASSRSASDPDLFCCDAEDYCANRVIFVNTSNTIANYVATDIDCSFFYRTGQYHSLIHGTIYISSALTSSVQIHFRRSHLMYLFSFAARIVVI